VRCFWILAAFIVGFFAPRYILGRLIRSRQQRVRWGLADALDLMVISIESRTRFERCHDEGQQRVKAGAPGRQ